MRQTPDIVIIGNIAYDIFVNGNENIKNFGGAGYYAGVASSLHTQTAVVSRVGGDFDFSRFKNLISKINLDISAVKVLNKERTINFTTKYLKSDGSIRKVLDDISENLYPCYLDIPEEYFQAKYFYITTNPAHIQLKLIDYIKSHSNAKICVDTIDDYADDPLTKIVFDKADIAFIDKEYTNLLKCNANVKIIKHGKKGNTLIINNKIKNVINPNIIDNVVDKTGAGDILNASILAFKNNGYDFESAIKEAQKIATYSTTQFGISHLIDYGRQL